MGKKLRVGIWGLGRSGHISEITQHHKGRVEISAVCDIDELRAMEYGKKLDVPYYSDPNKFLADKNIDIAVIATYSPDHIRHARQALEAGIAVFIEKPIAASRADAEELVELDKKYPNKIFICHNRRFESAFQHVREIIASGILGKVHTIKLCRNNYSRRDDWQTLIKNNGGQLNNWGSHLIDQALQFLDYEVKSVWSELKLIAAQGDAEDCVKIILQGKSGLTVDIEIFNANALKSNIYEVYGDRGALFSDNENDLRMRYIDPDYELKKFPVNTGHPNEFIFADDQQIPWRRMTIMTEPALKVNIHSIYAFLADSLLDGKEFPITLSQALAVVEICDIVRSQSPIYRKDLAK